MTDLTHARVAVLGAGVIGRVLAAELFRGGADVVLVARGDTAARLRADGVRLDRGGTATRADVPIVDTADPGERDVVIVAVRAGQLDGTWDTIAAMGRPVVVTTMHLADRWPALVEHVGEERLVRAFPGLGGYVVKGEGRGDDEGRVEGDRGRPGTGEAEVVRWADLGSKQPLTIDGAAVRGDEVTRLLARTGLPVATTPDMTGWLDTHVVFVGTLGAGVALAGGSAPALAADAPLLRRTCDAVRDGLRALHDRGIRIEPRPVDLLHRRMPGWFAPPYWRRALRGPIGEVTIAPHVRASRHDELPLLCREAIEVAGGGRTGALGRFLAPLAAPAGPAPGDAEAKTGPSMRPLPPRSRA